MFYIMKIKNYFKAKLIYLLLVLSVITACNENNQDAKITNEDSAFIYLQDSISKEIINETERSWIAYKEYAWGHDVLKPLSKSFHDWYAEPLYISPIDAYSTLHLMGLTKHAKEIENYVIDSLNFNKDIDAKIFEVNIRILGGLLSMYELSENPKILGKAKDFADRMLPAFQTKTGIPKYWVNLKTGIARGDIVNVAEAATYTMEMGILSYYANDPKYYQAGKKATLAIYKRRSEIGLIGERINVETGEWISEESHICAGVDSYYEYLYKSYLLFGDPDLKEIWDNSITKVHEYLQEYHENKLWYARANMNTGEKTSSVVTLYDAFFPAILAISGDLENAKKYLKTWDWLWNKYGLEPMVYDYKKDTPNYPVYDLNPEIIESTYYLYHLTGDSMYFYNNLSYWNNIKKFCRNDIAFTSVEDVQTMTQKDYMPTFFFAETLKYFYLTFSHHINKIFLDEHVFNTEAHQFIKKSFDHKEAKLRLQY